MQTNNAKEIVESVEIVSNPKMRKQIELSEKDIQEGRTKEIKSVKDLMDDAYVQDS